MLNRCEFIGNLTHDVEIRYLPSGQAVGNFSIAVNWKGKEKEGVEYVRLVAFDKLAENCAKYMAKGHKCYASGRMQTRKWTDQNNVERYSTEIVADAVIFLGKPQGKTDAQLQDEGARPGRSNQGQANSMDDFPDDDIRF